MNCGACKRRRRKMKRRRNHLQRLFSIKDDVKVIIYGIVTNITRKEGRSHSLF
jgi:hypothetical protein